MKIVEYECNICHARSDGGTLKMMGLRFEGRDIKYNVVNTQIHYCENCLLQLAKISRFVQQDKMG